MPKTGKPVSGGSIWLLPGTVILIDHKTKVDHALKQHTLLSDHIISKQENVKITMAGTPRVDCQYLQKYRYYHSQFINS